MSWPGPSAAGRARSRRSLVGLGPFSLLIALSCSPAPPAAQRLLGPDLSYRPLALVRADLGEEVLDFTSMSALEGLRVAGADSRLTPEGLLLEPAGRDPRLILDGDELRHNLVRVEMAAARGGELRVFWGAADEPFARERSERLSVQAAERIQTYEIDLSARLGPSAGRRFRIDPIDRQAEVRIRRISLLRVGYLPAEGADRIGKATIGEETREAVGLRAGHELARPIRGAGAGARLLFGLGRVPGNDAPITVRVGVSAGGESRTVFAQRLGAEAARGWVDHEVELGRCPRRGCEVTIEAVQKGASELAGAVLVANPVVVSGGRSDLPNVILLSLDTLGARHLSAHGAAPGGTPHLDDLGRRGVLFENAFAQSSLTHSSHGSLLTGSAPLATAFYWLDGAVGDEITLADALRAGGYQTAAFTGGVILTEKLGFDKGFDVFYRHDTLYRPAAERTDVESLAARALAWVEGRRPAPVFLFFHTYEVHGPYVDRDGSAPLEDRYFNAAHMKGSLPVDESELGAFLRTLTPEGREITYAEAGRDPSLEAVRAAYRSEIGFLDSAVGRLLEELERAGVLDDAIVVVTSDHGEAFFEHGLVEHGLLYAENLHVPLLIEAPGRLPAGRRVPQAVSAIDVAPTLLDLTGLDAPAGMEGSSLVPLARGDDSAERRFYSLVIGNGMSFQTGGRHKLIRRAAFGQENYGADELFDLAADPAEERNLLAEGISPPTDLDRWARRTMAQLPGVHVDLSALSGTTWELELPLGRSYRDRVYAFDVERLRLDGDDPEVLRVTAAFSDSSRLILRDRRPDRDWVLDLASPADGRAYRYVLQPPDEPGADHRLEVRAAADSPAIGLWRVSGATTAGRGFSAEDEEKLRALGYLN